MFKLNSIHHHISLAPVSPTKERNEFRRGQSREPLSGDAGQRLLVSGQDADLAKFDDPLTFFLRP